MVIEKEKNTVKLFYKDFPFFFNLIGFFVNIRAIKPRRWALSAYLFFVFFPSSLQASSLPTWEVGSNGLNISSLVAIQLDENLSWGATFMKPSDVDVKDRFGLNKWFSEAFRKAKEIVLFVPYLYEQMNCETCNNGSDNTNGCDDWIYFHVTFWPGILVIVVMNLLEKELGPKNWGQVLKNQFLYAAMPRERLGSAVFPLFIGLVGYSPNDLYSRLIPQPGSPNSDELPVGYEP